MSFRACHNAKKYLRHKQFELYSETYDTSQLYKLDATFTERYRFFEGTTAFESVNFPNRFIRHQNFRLKLHVYDATSLYKKDASFYEIQYNN